VSSSIWKKEISLRKKAKVEDAVLPPAPVAADRIEERTAPPPLGAPSAAPAEPVPAPLPEQSGDYGWLTMDFDPGAVPEQMPTIVAPVVSVPEVSARIPVAEVAAGAVVAAAAASAPVTERAVPFWKKEV
jgi:hypothetical protein